MQEARSCRCRCILRLKMWRRERARRRGQWRAFARIARESDPPEREKAIPGSGLMETRRVDASASSADATSRGVCLRGGWCGAKVRT